MKKLQVKVRKFNENDINLKVKWINDSAINKYLHYNLPLEESKTLVWYEKIKDLENRLDCTIDVLKNDSIDSVGLIGLLNIDNINKKAEFYICLGEKNYHGQGIAKKASIEMIKQGFDRYNLNKVYLYTEVENIGAQKLFESIGFRKEGLLVEDLIYNGKKIDRFVYGINRKDFVYEI